MSERNAEETNNASRIIAKKELKLLFKSKRRIFLLTITPLMILLIGVIAVITASTISDNPDPTTVWVINDSPSNFTDTLLDYYKVVNNTDYVVVDGSFDELRNDPNMNVLVYIPSNFTSLVQSQQQAVVGIVYNQNSTDNQQIAIALAQLTEIYEQQVLVKEVQPDLLIPIIDGYEEDTDGISEELASNIFIIPVYIIFFVVIPPISLVMISVTIEREEKTLETLFLQPVTRQSIIMGKIMYGMGLILTIVLLDVLAVIIDVILITFFIEEEAGSSIVRILEEGVDLFGIDLIIYFFFVILLISIAVVGLAVLLSLIAKDEREANLISGVLPMAIFSIIFLVQIVEITELSQVWQIIVVILPVVGILLAFYLAMVAGSISLVAILSIIAQILWIGLIVSYTARLSESESILELNFTRVSNEILRMLRIKR